MSTPTAVIRTELQKQVGGYRPQLPHAGDMEMWLRLAVYSSVGALDAYQAVYRRHSGNMSNRYTSDGRLPDLKQRKKALDCFFETCSGSLRDANRLRGKLMSDLARCTVGLASAAFNDAQPRYCEELLAFALEIHPDITRSGAWLKLACKKRIGRGAWQLVRPAVNKFRQAISQ